MERFHRLCELERKGAPLPIAQRAERRVWRKGKEQLLEEARRLRVRLDSGEYASLGELGWAVGLSGTWVGWLLGLPSCVLELVQLILVDDIAEPDPPQVCRSLRGWAY